MATTALKKNKTNASRERFFVEIPSSDIAFLNIFADKAGIR
jgi:hypothetical protein